jgi:pimeloyl-ACP methyl ester carboxylesterase
LRNHGESGKRLVTLGAHESRDIEAVLEWLRRNKGADSFVLWGVSLGAASSLIAAVGEPDVDGLILEACYESMRKTADRHRRIYFAWIPRQPFLPLTFAWFKWRTGVSPDDVDLVRAASELKRGKIFLISGEKDVRAPAAAGREICEAAAVPCETWIMPGIDHDSLGGHPEYEERVAKFLNDVSMEEQ